MTDNIHDWVKSEDAGYLPGKLLLDRAGGHWSVYRGNGRMWVAAWVVNSICRRSATFRTRREAVAHAEQN